MKLIQSPRTDPKWNLALEEYVFDHMDPAHSYFMLWQNRNTIVVGKFQNTAGEIDNDFVRQNDITVVRERIRRNWQISFVSITVNVIYRILTSCQEYVARMY